MIQKVPELQMNYKSTSLPMLLKGAPQLSRDYINIKQTICLFTVNNSIGSTCYIDQRQNSSSCSVYRYTGMSSASNRSVSPGEDTGYSRQVFPRVPRRACGLRDQKRNPATSHQMSEMALVTHALLASL